MDNKTPIESTPNAPDTPWEMTSEELSLFAHSWPDETADYIMKMDGPYDLNFVLYVWQGWPVSLDPDFEPIMARLSVNKDKQTTNDEYGWRPLSL